MNKTFYALILISLSACSTNHLPWNMNQDLPEYVNPDGVYQIIENAEGGPYPVRCNKLVLGYENAKVLVSRPNPSVSDLSLIGRYQDALKLHQCTYTP